LKISTQIVIEYLTKWGNLPSLTLAKKIYNENKEVFPSVETARSSIRYFRAANGDERRRKLATKDFVDYNPYKLPESDETEFFPYTLPDLKSVLLLSDIHIPYHSIDALTACFTYAENEQPDAVLLNGDTIDFFKLSRFAKDPKARSFAHELLAFKQFFEAVQKIFPAAKIYFKSGNHEERYDHFLWMKAGELDGVEEFKLENIIKARANGIEFIGDKRIIKLGHLNVLHGHEFGGSIFSPVNIARGLFLRG